MKKALALLVTILSITSISFANSNIDLKEFPKEDPSRNVKKSFPMSRIDKDGRLTIDRTDKRYYKDIIKSLQLSENTEKSVYKKTFSSMEFRTMLGKNSKLPHNIHSVQLDIESFLKEVGGFGSRGGNFGLILVDNELNAIKGYLKFQDPSEELPKGKATFQLVRDEFKKVSLLEPAIIKDSVIKEEMTLDTFMNKYLFMKKLVSNILKEVQEVKDLATEPNEASVVDDYILTSELKVPTELTFNDLIYVFRPYFNSTNCGMLKEVREDFFKETDVGTLTAGYRAWEFKKNGKMYTLILGY